MIPMGILGAATPRAGGGATLGDYAVALLHFNESDGSTTFTDETGRTWTAYGNAQIDTAQSKFGGSSALFDGSGDYIQTANSSDFDFTSSDFTVACWYRSSSTISSTQQLIGQWDDDYNLGWSTRVYSTNAVSITTSRYDGRYDSSRSVFASSVITTAQWQHLEFSKSGSVYSVFVDGIKVAEKTITTPTKASTSPIKIGGGSNNLWVNGHIDEMLVLKGLALHTSDFTPPTSPYSLDDPI